jgi:hypothetical protein
LVPSIPREKKNEGGGELSEKPGKLEMADGKIALAILMVDK